MKKVFEAIFDGHQIRVENRWFAGEKLYVDGDCRMKILVCVKSNNNWKFKDG